MNYYIKLEISGEIAPYKARTVFLGPVKADKLLLVRKKVIDTVCHSFIEIVEKLPPGITAVDAEQFLSEYQAT
jgi:hypothetical protein